MAGDWIKMRVGLVNHPKVIQLSEVLSYDEDYQEWSGLHGFIPALGGDQKSYEDGIYQALRVTRYVTVTALLKFWGYANEHVRDEFIASLRIQDIDEITQVPGFGNALSEVGWAVFDEEKRGVFLPNFSEHNVSSGDRTNADRQKRYREKKRLEKENSNVTQDVTRNDREEKRREENINKEPKGSMSDSLESNAKRQAIPYQKIVDLYHEKLPRCPRVEILTAKRKAQIGARWNSGELDTLESWGDFFDHCSQSKFLMGAVDPTPGHKRFVADLEWLTKESNYTKIVEGKYHHG